MISYPTGDGPSQTVLIVDDERETRKLLTDAMTADGYQVVAVSRGEEALSQIKASPPDIILLDLVMPGIDGIEVCRRLQADPETAHLPVLLMTAHRRRELRLEGISAGARDFLLKPLDIADLRVRVRNAGEMKRLYDESVEQFRRIAELETLRDSLVHMIVHDLKSPLTTVMGNLQLMEMLLSEDTDPGVREAFDGCVLGAQNMNDLVSSILAVSKLESGTISLDLSESALFEVAEEACSIIGPRASQIQISETPAPGSVRVQSDVGLVQRVILNLLSNALDHSPAEHPVVVHISQDDNLGRVSVVDRGPGVPEELRDSIFEKFGQVSGAGKARKGSVGLGLTFCKLAVEAHGGRIGVESSDGGGSAFWFEFPLMGPKAGDTGILGAEGGEPIRHPAGK